MSTMSDSCFGVIDFLFCGGRPRRTANGTMVVVLALLMAIPPLAVLTGISFLVQFSVYLMLLDFFVVGWYAPWYFLLSILPLILLHGQISFFGAAPNVILDMWAWSLYGYVKGIYHVTRWERESQEGIPHHPVTKHPWLLAGTALAAGVGVHYAGKIGKER